jgi:hypothetical protein
VCNSLFLSPNFEMLAFLKYKIIWENVLFGAPFLILAELIVLDRIYFVLFE